MREKRGGARKGSGPKKKYSEDTTMISFRCPKSKAEEMKKSIKAKLLKYIKK